jgi:hypothetical protein
MATVESMKKEMTGMVHNADLAQITQRLDETHTSRVESVKKELSNIMTTVENMKKESGKFNLLHVFISLVEN